MAEESRSHLAEESGTHVAEDSGTHVAEESRTGGGGIAVSSPPLSFIHGVLSILMSFMSLIDERPFLKSTFSSHQTFISAAGK